MNAESKASDVVVIGGGIVGASIAFRAACAGLSVTLVERGRCGGGASWAGAGIIDPGSEARSDPLAVLRKASVARYPDFVAELRERSGVDPQLIRCGILDLITDDNQDAATDREVKAAAGRLTADGRLAIERLSTRQARALEPALSRRIRGARLTREAMQVRNPRLMSALRLACIQAGVRLLEHTPVLNLTFDGQRVSGVQTPDAALAADHVVIAAGAWSSRIDRRLDGLIEVHPVRGQIVLLEQTPPPLKCVIMSGRKYIVCRADGRILCGSTEEPRAGFDARSTAGGTHEILSFVHRYVPSLESATLLRSWAGLRPASRDNKPYIGPVKDTPGLIAATGHFRSGLTLAPVTADIVVRLLTSRDPDFDLTPFIPGRPAAHEANAGPPCDDSHPGRRCAPTTRTGNEKPD
ncbi:MAG: glycine oxidase ThiO [Planctomycetes bacterium]|nr:glycine oxidase ThiO [Planctomycetota bacterium]